MTAVSYAGQFNAVLAPYAYRAAYTRAKAAVLDLQRPGLCETRTLRWRGKDSNSRSPQQGCRLILGEEKGPAVDQIVSKDAVPFHGGPVVRIRLPPPASPF